MPRVFIDQRIAGKPNHEESSQNTSGATPARSGLVRDELYARAQWLAKTVRIGEGEARTAHHCP